MPAAWQHVKSGRLKAIAVASDKRSVTAPDVPTIAEQGIDCVVNSWYGALVPAKTPPAIVAKLNAAMVKALQSPDVRAKLFAQGAEATSSSPAEFEQLIKDELKKWDYVIREANITPE
jgi:tripartite-type tricarboxylate transporter receptor subunit TctC